MLLRHAVSLDDTDTPLDLDDVPIPKVGSKEVLLRVRACGVCHTELDEIEGRVAPSILPIVLGHQVVGHVAELGSDATRFQEGDRVGVGWIYASTGASNENLSPEFRATGRDANGGYAEFMTVPEDYAYPIPEAYSDEYAAPLLCAGAIGYRALKLTNLVDGQRLGLTGFGGSAHLVIQLAHGMFPHSEVYVFARDESVRAFARQLGAVWAGDTTDRAPQKLHAVIDTTPVWKPAVEAMKNLAPGGRLVINAIRKVDTDKACLQQLSYHEDLWMEREIKTVANITQHDIRDFLPLAAGIPLTPTIETYRLEDANIALAELKRGQIRGAKVLTIG